MRHSKFVGCLRASYADPKTPYLSRLRLVDGVQSHVGVVSGIRAATSEWADSGVRNRCGTHRVRENGERGRGGREGGRERQSERHTERHRQRHGRRHRRRRTARPTNRLTDTEKNREIDRDRAQRKTISQLRVFLVTSSLHTS